MKRISLLAALFAAAAVAAPLAAQAGSKAELFQLTDLIEETGTEIALENCRSNAAGYYQFEKDKIDKLTICKNNVDTTDLDAVWEVVSHEATHVMQACTTTTALKPEYHPRMWRELDAKAPHYSKILTDQYTSSRSVREAEAFWMELQEPEFVVELFKVTCMGEN